VVVDPVKYPLYDESLLQAFQEGNGDVCGQHAARTNRSVDIVECGYTSSRSVLATNISVSFWKACSRLSS